MPAPMVNDPRLAGRGLAELTDILRAAGLTEDEVVTVAVESGLDRSLLHKADTPGQTVSEVIRSADAAYPHGLTTLLDRYREVLISRKSRTVLARLDAWLQRGPRQDSLTAAISSVINGADSVAGCVELRNIGDLLEVIHGALIDIAAAVDAGVADENILTTDPVAGIAEKHDTLVAACRRARAANDLMLNTVRNAGRLAASRPANVAEGAAIARDTSVDVVLSERREILEAELRQLRLTFAQHLPNLMRRESA